MARRLKADRLSHLAHGEVFPSAQDARQRSEARLRTLITRETTICAIYRGSSGLTDWYSCYVFTATDSHWLDRSICAVTGLRVNDRRQAITVGGYGYNKPAHIADQLESILGFIPKVERI